MSNNYYTSRLLKTIEPYNYNGVNKCLFYTEVNTNINVGDKVFISNGIFDSEYGINKSTDRHGRGTDGYKVLFIDKTKIVLDIDYLPVASYNIRTLEDFISIYKVNNIRDFNYFTNIYIDTISTTRYNKFQRGLTNNILFVDSINILYDIISYDPTIQFTYRKYEIGSTTVYQDYIFNNNTIDDLLFNKVFLSKRDNNTNTYEVVNLYFDTNGFKFNDVNDNNSYFYSEFRDLIYLNEDEGTINYYKSPKIYIQNDDITYKGVTYIKRNIYRYTSIDGIYQWDIDITYKQPIISKNYFKNGLFKGVHNNGIFGNYKSRKKWKGDNTWNSGFMINSIWEDGIMNSKDSDNDSYYTTYDSNDQIVLSSDSTNNKGFGYNYIIDTKIKKGIIQNGNFVNCEISNDDEDYYLDKSINGGIFNNNIILKSGLYNLCDFKNVYIEGSKVKDSYIEKSFIKNSIINSNQIGYSVCDDSIYNNENGINVIAADLWSYIEGNYDTGNPEYNISNNIRGVLKLYISENDYKRLDIFESFFISNVNKEVVISSITNDQKIKIPIETKYILDSYKDYNLMQSDQLITCSLKTPKENKYKRFVQLDSFNISTNTYVYSIPSSVQNDYSKYYSIDIDLGNYLSYYYDIQNSNKFEYVVPKQNRILNISNVDRIFKNINLTNSSFSNGIIKNSIIERGDFSNINNYIEYNLDNLDISFDTVNNYFNINIKNYSLNNLNEQLSIDDFIWIKGIYFEDANNSNEKVYIDGVYKISDINNNIVSIEMTSNIYEYNISNIDNSTVFKTDDTKPNYISLYTNIIEKSQIISGTYYNTNLSGNNIYNKDFNNNDIEITLSNINRLRIFNTLFSNLTENTINSGIIYNSHLLNDSFKNGIIYNSIWNNNIPFEGGIITKSFWINGIFNNGIFYDNNENNINNIKFIETSSNTLDRKWYNGTFNNGTFNKSKWQDGIFNNGKFITSNAINGEFLGGFIGDKSLLKDSTTIGLDTNNMITLNNNVTILNAKVGGDGFVEILNCNFQGGELTSNSNGNTIWYYGTFNGGDLTNNVKWKNGIFNGGKFLSTYDNTIQFTDVDNILNFSWENGVFNGGYFGSVLVNPSWFKGEFNGGEYSGKYWRNGVFTNGVFSGNITSIVIDNIFDYDNSTNKLINLIDTNYGIWIDGKLSSSNYEEDKVVYTKLTRKTDTKSKIQNVEFKNSIWLNGIFDHNNGIFNNSIFSKGLFKNGNFENSLFNTYSVRIQGNNPEFSNHDDCIWENGVFKSGYFYYSNWNNGVWINGTMTGAIWNNGVWNNGFANNILWKKGRWKNGIWNGSPFNIDNNTSSDNITLTNITKSLMDNIWSGITQSYIESYGSYINYDDNITEEQYLDDYYRRDKMIKNDGKYYHINNVVGGSSSETSVLRTNINTLFDTNELTTTSTYYKPWSWQSSNNTYRCSNIFANTTSNYIIFRNKYYDITSNSIKTDRNIFRDITYSYKVKFRSYISSPTSNVRLYIVSGGYVGTPGTSIILETGQTLYFDNSVEYNGLPYVILNTSIQIFKITYYPKDSDNKELRFFVKNENPSTTITAYIGADSTTTDFDIVSAFRNQYDSSNNKLLKINGSNEDNILSTTGTQTYLNFGNGRFISGVWENGYWNDGFNDNISLNIIFKSVLSHNKINSNNHEIILEEILGDNNSELYNRYEIGDRVSISNIAAYDVNEDRIHMKNIFELKDKYLFDGKFRFKFYVKTSESIRSLDIDSDLHEIIVSKTLLIGGNFYNGLFENTNLNIVNIDGNNNTMKLYDSHIIEGTLNGCYIGNINNIRKSLIQHMIFFDNTSISKTESDFLNPTTTYNPLPNSTNRKYSTILDLIYEDTLNDTLYESTNIYQESSYISNNNYVESKLNLNGYITRDVLSSTSTFKNLYDLNDNKYQLGYKYREYDNYIPNDGKFNKKRFAYITDPNDSNINANIFEEDGWEVNVLDTSTSSYSTFISNTNGYGNTIDYQNSDNLLININNENLILDNNNTKDIEPQRYITLDMKISIDFTTSTNINYNNSGELLPRIYLNNKYEQYSINSNILVNHLSKLNTDGILSTKEFFYNKQSLNMTLYSLDISNFKLGFKEISFKEVNMIPFFNYYNIINIDNDFKTPKLNATLPTINDNDSNLIDDISLIPKNIL